MKVKDVKDRFNRFNVIDADRRGPCPEPSTVMTTSTDKDSCLGYIYRLGRQTPSACTNVARASVIIMVVHTSISKSVSEVPVRR